MEQFSMNSTHVLNLCLIRRVVQLSLACAIVFGSSQLEGDILIDDFSSSVNDRFTNSGSFVGNGLDFSGVARTSNNGRWGTLVSRNAVLTAAHFRPSVGSSFFFYETNDPNGVRHEAIVTGGLRVTGTDLYVSILDRNVDQSIKVYDFASEPLSSDPNPGGSVDQSNAGSWQDLNAYMFGVSPTGWSSRELDIAVGRNLISGYDENIPFGSNTDNDTLSLTYNADSDSDYVTNEAYVQSGDSGAPLLVESNGSLVLLGINSFQITDGDPVTFRATGVTYTGNQASAINSILTANAVPEPNSLIMAFGFFGLASLARKRRARV